MRENLTLVREQFWQIDLDPLQRGGQIHPVRPRVESSREVHHHVGPVLDQDRLQSRGLRLRLGTMMNQGALQRWMRGGARHAQQHVGKLFLDALIDGDTNVLLPWVMVTAVFIIGFNLLADILYGVLDPRIRLS